MKILILGSSGMLGKYMFSFLKTKYDNIYCTRRKDFEINTNTNSESISNVLKKYNINENDIVINCIGLIKPQVDKYGTTLSIIVNSLFPNLLAEECFKIKAKMIHITTDCVFSGKKGNYIENDIHDVSDVYGRTKSLGEPNNCTVIRTSIIGEEIGQKRSLVEWVKSNANKEINGFNDHFWNGLTCLQVAKVINEIIRNDKFWIGVRHIHSNKINKFELVSIINDIYNLNIKINNKKSENSCDRSMSSIYEIPFDIPNLKEQIEEMKNFKLQTNE
jgi:dTDP-4-dehydrorhamnose reductase